MILELDCGNSFIKWRILSWPEQAVLHVGIVDSLEHLFTELDAVARVSISHCRLVSVRSDAETVALVTQLRIRFAVEPVCAVPARRQGEVINGYDDHARLGLDRWLAVLGGYHLGQRACLIIDLGTAVTADLVACDGRHLGGFICPGVPLMREQLSTHTRRIRYDRESAALALSTLDPGRSTAQAVERGCVLMLRGFVREQYQEALRHFPQGVEVFLTGGDVDLVRDVIPGAQVVPDLVFVGLAIACPLV
ncbi:type III pantothenate kinase [Pseudomonas sp. GOM7]|uniref:type III pantothenate kinase n=1 Tax=Pseudomonas sp. GOM7 TaxID=2998079 RepID=UPI00227CE917|nr:type III pantothenate kinase [Pseudomonas sp. GOM7]WAJ38256.1 type III pantothenate kinase [Pseudomonas sp. GOM7]